MKEEKDQWSMKTMRVTRKLYEDESILFDKNCPKCGAKLIFRWVMKDRAYAPTGRCSSVSCHYGN